MSLLKTSQRSQVQPKWKKATLPEVLRALADGRVVRMPRNRFMYRLNHGRIEDAFTGGDWERASVTLDHREQWEVEA